jgi:hypothetical protein
LSDSAFSLDDDNKVVKTKVMISYCHAQKPLALKIKEWLEMWPTHYVVWIDMEQI